MELSRRAAGESPELDASLRTERLVVGGKGAKQPRFDGKNVSGPPPFRSADLDADVALKIGPKGLTELDASILDRQGATFVRVAGRATLPYRDLVGGNGNVLAALSPLPFDVEVALPRRAVSEFPPPFGPLPVRGDVEIAARAQGTLLEPKVELDGTARGVARKGGAAVRAIDGKVNARYDGKRAEAFLGVSRDGASALDARAVIDVNARDLLRRRKDLPWSASATLGAKALPLGAVPLLGDRGVPASGTLEAQASHDGPPKGRVALASDDLRTETTEAARVRIIGTLSERALDATSRIEQPGGWADLRRAHCQELPRGSPRAFRAERW
jgi:hypothetical protein